MPESFTGRYVWQQYPKYFAGTVHAHNLGELDYLQNDRVSCVEMTIHD